MMPNKSDNVHEKGHLASKKFVAFLVTEVGLFTLLGIAILLGELDTLGENLAFMVLAVTAGFVAVGYILGQSSLDRYVRVAMITAGKADPGPGPGPDEKKPEEE